MVVKLLIQAFVCDVFLAVTKFGRAIFMRVASIRTTIIISINVKAL